LDKNLKKAAEEACKKEKAARKAADAADKKA
jgi:hypothetical protein